VNRGYVYSGSFLSDGEAEAEFRKKNPKVEATRVVKFVSGRYERGWVKNVVAIGNSGGFVEPLESTSLAAICKECHALAGSMQDRDLRPGPTVAAAYNRNYRQTWDDIRRFLAIHYVFNTRLDTPFWRAARADTDLAGAEEFVEFYRENGPTAVWKDELVHGHDVFGFEGYLAMMVGQRVPYRHAPAFDGAERQTFAQIRAHLAAQAASGLTVAEALRVIHHSPDWKVRPDFYHYP
jgi:tryptophan halogenase